MKHSDPRALLRHAAATLAYRAGKVLRDFPAESAGYRATSATRTPLEILSHLGDLMDWAESLARGGNRWEPARESDWTAASERFFRNLAALDAALVSADDPATGTALAQAPAEGGAVERILQGPIADALTHVGQIALLRGMLGSPVRPESYARAEIRAGRVGPEQAAPRAEFDGDASTRPRRSGDASRS